MSVPLGQTSEQGASVIGFRMSHTERMDNQVTDTSQAFNFYTTNLSMCKVTTTMHFLFTTDKDRYDMVVGLQDHHIGQVNGVV